MALRRCAAVPGAGDLRRDGVHDPRDRHD
jgi:hypothetical protein